MDMISHYDNPTGRPESQPYNLPSFAKVIAVARISYVFVYMYAYDRSNIFYPRRLYSMQLYTFTVVLILHSFYTNLLYSTPDQFP